MFGIGRVCGKLLTEACVLGHVTFSGNKFTCPKRVLTKPLPDTVQEGGQGAVPALRGLPVSYLAKSHGWETDSHYVRSLLERQAFQVPRCIRSRIDSCGRAGVLAGTKHKLLSSLASGRIAPRLQLSSRTPVLKNVAPPQFLCLQRAPLTQSVKQELSEVWPTHSSGA